MNKYDPVKVKMLDDVMADLNKNYGTGTIMRLGDAPASNVEALPTGSFMLDYLLHIGGLPKGRIVEIYGPESCLDEHTIIPCYIKDPEGKGNAHRQWTVKRFYERFHHINVGGKGNYLRDKTNNYEFYVASINSENRIFRNKVANVIHTGVKLCFKITVNGNSYSVIVSEDHKFYIGNSTYKSLKQGLSIGDTVFIHNNTHFKRKNKKFCYREVFVKYHPTNNIKVVNGSTYCRINYSTLLYEAFLNKLTPTEYRNVLNTKSKTYIDENIECIPVGYVIHHKDGNHKNDVLSNYILLTGIEHNRLHAIENHNDLRFVAVASVIDSIEFVGDRDTYDIKCFAPHNNYIANKFVVHNSGKTTLCLHIIAKCQQLGGSAAFIDAEHALDLNYAKRLGVDTSNLLLAQPDCGEDALSITETLTSSGAMSVITIDSVAALVPRSEIEGGMGDASMAVQARLMSQAMRKLTGIVSRTNTILIFINQLRSKVGIAFGNPETTTGGNALKFYASVRIDIRRIAAIKVNDVAVGNKTKLKIVKSKVSPPFREGEIEIYYNQGISNATELIDLGVMHNLIKQAGAWYTYGENRFQGKADFINSINTNKDLFSTLATDVEKVITAARK